MRVRVVKQTDVHLSGERKALFEGQAYVLPLEVAEGLIAAGKVVSLEPTFQEAPVYEPERTEEEEKAVHGPPEDKALKPQRNKRRRRRG